MYRKFVRPFFVALDNPEVEQLAGVDDVVFVAEFLLEISNLISRISGNDTVYQSACKLIGCLYPVDEIIAEFPLICVLEDDSL